jgi:hypothetical protein
LIPLRAAVGALFKESPYCFVMRVLESVDQGHH